VLDEFLGHKVVVDLRSTYVCLGTLKQVDAEFLDLRDADFHDIRDTDTTRENYVAESVATGVKRNRKRVILFRGEVVAISRLSDVVDE
jgi:small nuclear ribonucleoprotein (snRNP)-like protein